MNGGRQPTAGSESLTIRQLEDRLQLTMAVRTQIENQGTVHREQMRVALESIGLELPADMPLNSYTQMPSRQNLEQTKHVLSQHQEQALVNLVGSFKRSLKQSMDSIHEKIWRPASDVKSALYKLRCTSNYCSDVNWTELTGVEDPAIQAECAIIEEAMNNWLGLQQLGLDAVSAFGSLYEDSRKAAVYVQEALQAKLTFATAQDADRFCGLLGTLSVRISTARHAEPVVNWTATELVNNVNEFGDQYKGPLAHLLQHESVDFDELFQQLDSLREQDVLEYRLCTIAEAIDSFLHDCWRLEGAFVRAVDSSMAICTSLYHLKTLTA